MPHVKRISIYKVKGQFGITFPIITHRPMQDFFAKRLEEEIDEYKRHSLWPGSGFHGVLRHPQDSAHTQHNVQETHANLKEGRETTQTMQVNNVGSALIMSQSQTEGIVVNLHLRTPSIYYPSDQGENNSIQIIAELYELR